MQNRKDGILNSFRVFIHKTGIKGLIKRFTRKEIIVCNMPDGTCIVTRWYWRPSCGQQRQAFRGALRDLTSSSRDHDYCFLLRLLSLVDRYRFYRKNLLDYLFEDQRL